MAIEIDHLEIAVRSLDEDRRFYLIEGRCGAGGRLYSFVHPPSAGGVLVELIQHEEQA
jgi:hypothetical protein